LVDRSDRGDMLYLMRKRPLAIAFDAETIAKLDRVAKALSERAAGMRVTRSDIVRAAVDRGLAALEIEAGLTRRPRSSKARD
jgi:hypothetical protein